MNKKVQFSNIKILQKFKIFEHFGYGQDENNIANSNMVITLILPEYLPISYMN